MIKYDTLSINEDKQPRGTTLETACLQEVTMKKPFSCPEYGFCISYEYSTITTYVCEYIDEFNLVIMEPEVW